MSLVNIMFKIMFIIGKRLSYLITLSIYFLNQQ